jgi:hypothetical protein
LKTAVFSTREYDCQFLDEANRKFKHELIYHPERLHRATAPVAAGCPAVCAFVDEASRRRLGQLPNAAKAREPHNTLADSPWLKSHTSSLFSVVTRDEIDCHRTILSALGAARQGVRVAKPKLPLSVQGPEIAGET